MTAESRPRAEVEIVREDPRWDAAGFDLQAVAEEAAALALAAAGTPPGDWSVSLLAAEDARVASLNGAFRGRPEPTNVLSWPAFELSAAASGLPPGARPADPPAEPDAPGEPVLLGDVALAWDTVAREAQATGIAVEDHVRHLILHGVLHLLGYDHETDADAGLMEGLESRALVWAGRADPYEANDPRRDAARAHTKEGPDRAETARTAATVRDVR